MESDLIGRRLGPFEIEELIGNDGLAEVFRGRDTEHNHQVVIKLAGRGLAADPVFQTRFRRDARGIASLRHPNIAPVYDFGQAENGHYMITDAVEGVTLADVLDQVRAGERTLAAEDIAFVIRQIAAALDHAHAKGVTHGDVRPSHIILTRSGQAILTDFGLALLTSQGLREGESGAASMAYMAPEQIADARTASPSSDVYSLGVIVYELITGQVPFEVDSEIDSALRDLQDTAPDPRFLNEAVSASVAAVTLKALSRSPADRFRSAMQLASLLERAYANPDAGEEIFGGKKPQPVVEEIVEPVSARRPAVKSVPLTREERQEQRRQRAEQQRAKRVERREQRRVELRQFREKWGRTTLVMAIVLLLLIAVAYVLQTAGVLQISFKLPTLPPPRSAEGLTETPRPTATWTPAPSATPIPSATALQASDSTPVAPVAFAPLDPGTGAFRIPDGQVMVFVPAGQFLMGTNARDRTPSSKPQHAVTLSAYWIDRTEITTDQYRQCVDAGSCPAPSDLTYYDQPVYGDYPVTFVNYQQAVAYCLWTASQTGQVIGLPTEAQWEKAAAWDPVNEVARIYPWGNEPPTPERLRYNESNVNRPAAPVGSYPLGVSAYGAYDMAGNVWEWTADWFDDTYYTRTGVSLDPQGPISGSSRTTRGGAWTRDGRLAISSVRNPVRPTTTSNEIGFRCAMTSGRPPVESGIVLTPIDFVAAAQGLLDEARGDPTIDGPTLDEWHAALTDLNDALVAVDHPGAAAFITARLDRLQTQSSSGLLRGPLVLKLDHGLRWILDQVAAPGDENQP